MEELTQDDVSHQHIVLMSLHIHLFKHRVPLSLSKKAIKRMENMENSLKEVASRIDSLLRKVEVVAKRWK